MIWPEADKPELVRVEASIDPSGGVPSTDFSITPSSFPTQSVSVRGGSEGPGEAMNPEVTVGGMEEGEVSVSVIGFAHNKLHHWACMEEKRRKRIAREI